MSEMAQNKDEAWIQMICEQHIAKAIAEERNPTVDEMTASVLYEIADELTSGMLSGNADEFDAGFTLSEADVEKICRACMEDPYIKERNKMVEW